MKMRLLTALIAATCFSQAASAAELTTGTLTNLTTGTADVMFNQPVTLVNSLTPVSGLKSDQVISGDKGVLIATGKLAIKEAGATAQLALKTSDVNDQQFVAYAQGHEGDDEYSFAYEAVPDTEGWDTFKNSDGNYAVSAQAQNQLTYQVIGALSSPKMTQIRTPRAGLYTISVTGAVYNP